jgi:hypothetical protein
MSKSGQNLEAFEWPTPFDLAGGGYLDGGIALRRRFELDDVDPELPYRLTLLIGARGGRLVVQQMVIVQREGGPPVDATGLRRVAIDRYLRRALADLMAEPRGLLVRLVGPPFEAPGGSTWAYTAEPSGADLQRAATIQRRRQSPAELLPKVAEAYRAALADPATARRPSLEVARRLFKSRTHAARLVAMAREAGLLGPATPGRAGEGIPAGEERP